MTLLDLFHRPTAKEALRDDLHRLGPVLFPGGRAQVRAAGESISRLLGHRLPVEAAARLYASARYVAHVSAQGARALPSDVAAAVVEHIVRHSQGRVTLDEAAVIWRQHVAVPGASPRFLRPQRARPPAFDGRTAAPRTDPRASAPGGADAPVCRLANDRRVVEMDLHLFGTVMAGLRATGYDGAAALFEAGGLKSLQGCYEVPENDARRLSRRLARLIVQSGLDARAAASLRPLVDIAGEGAFRVEA